MDQSPATSSSYVNSIESVHPEPADQSSGNSTRGSKRPVSYSSQPTNKRVLQLVAKRLEKGEGKYVAFGNHITQELSNMPPEMVPFVQKIINDAIFEGHMKTLNRTSRISIGEIGTTNNDNTGAKFKL